MTISFFNDILFQILNWINIYIHNLFCILLKCVFYSWNYENNFISLENFLGKKIFVKSEILEINQGILGYYVKKGNTIIIYHW